MVKGLKLFTDYFRNYQDCYILIGGAAVDTWMGRRDLLFRRTRDLDIILVIEALNDDFVKRFWGFIEKGEYQTKQKNDGTPKVYRFIKPGNEDYPFQVELFSRKPDITGDFEKAHLAPVPLGEELGSLSAILMNDEYYELTRKNAEVIDGLHLATTPVLICLKAKAFLDIRERLDKEGWKDGKEKNKLEKDYKKHRNDIILITSALTENDKIKLQTPIKEDVSAYIEATKADPPDYRILANNFEINEIKPEEVFKQLRETFEL